jgi:hypothetical protein
VRDISQIPLGDGILSEYHILGRFDDITRKYRGNIFFNSHGASSIISISIIDSSDGKMCRR